MLPVPMLPMVGKTARVLDRLSDHPSARDPEPFAGPDHPIRVLTRRMAFADEWTSAHAGRMTELFDGLAAEWADRVDSNFPAELRVTSSG